MSSLPFWQLDCRSQSYVLGICLDDRDLETLLPWHTIADLDGIPPELGRRNYVHSLCRAESRVSRKLTDLFDVRYLETVLDVRASSESRARELFLDAIRARRKELYPALLWALATDARSGVRVLGRHLMCECFLLGCRYLRDIAPA